MTRRVQRIVTTCAGYEPGVRAGGPPRSVKWIVEQASPEIQICLITSDRDLGDNLPYPGLSGQWVSRNNFEIFYLNIGRLAQWRSLLAQIRRDRVDVLYLNSLWDPVWSWIPIAAAAIHLIRPRLIVVAPRGELSPGATSIKPTKKQLALKLLLRPLAKHLRIAFHASTDLEAAHIRSNFQSSNIIVNCNQSEPYCPPLAPSEPDTLLRLIFVSRISPKKNLLTVLQAMQLSRQPMSLDIYGPIEDTGYWQRCLQVINSMPDHVQIRYRGMLQPAEVRRTFNLYDAFVFPTQGENYGHVIAESLSASCPVICSNQTPWTQILRKHGLPILEQPQPDSLAKILDEWSLSDPATRLQYKRAGASAYQEFVHLTLDQGHLFDAFEIESASHERSRG